MGHSSYAIAAGPVRAALASVLVMAGCTGAPGETPGASGPAPAGSASADASVPVTPLPASAEPSASIMVDPAPAAWASLQVAGSPSPREDHTWTLADHGRTAFLFGGRDGATVHGDLWAFDLTTDAWTQIEAVGGPAPRFGHEAVWVDGLGLVVFAGQAGATFFDDLWVFDPAATTWTALPAAGDVPVPRYGSCMALGPDGRLWISHGFTSDGTRFADTKAWDPATGAWTDETPDGELPVSRCLHGCWWTDDGQLVLFGGQTTGVTALDDRWMLSDAGWARVDATQPAARNLYARARVDGATLVLGGQALDQSFLSDGWWLLDVGGPAVPLEAVGTVPPGRAGAEAIVDLDSDRLLLFGGRDAGGALGDLWELAGLSGSAP
jgi:hypothetical protein